MCQKLSGKSNSGKNHQAQIMQDACILCEKCTIVCPQHAKARKMMFQV